MKRPRHWLKVALPGGVERGIRVEMGPSLDGGLAFADAVEAIGDDRFRRRFTRRDPPGGLACRESVQPGHWRIIGQCSPACDGVTCPAVPRGTDPARKREQIQQRGNRKFPSIGHDVPFVSPAVEFRFEFFHFCNGATIRLAFWSKVPYRPRPCPPPVDAGQRTRKRYANENDDDNDRVAAFGWCRQTGDLTIPSTGGS